MKRLMLGLVSLAVAACKAATPAVDPTGTGSPTLSPSPTATETSTPKVPVRAAVFADGAIQLYDVASDTVTPLANGAGIFGLTWVSADELAFGQDGTGTSSIRTINRSSAATVDVLSLEGDLLAFGFDPQQTSVATMVATADGFVEVEVHYLVGDRAVQRVTAMRLDGNDDVLGSQFSVAYSPGGGRLLVVQTANASGSEASAPLQVRSLDGRLEYWVDADREPTQATWLSDGSLVFRSLDGVRRWKPGKTESSPIGDLSTWFSPSASPAGRLVAYDTGRLTKHVQVRRVHALTGEVVDVGPAGRAQPIFAAQNEIWTQIVQRCRPDCLEPFVLGPLVFAVNPRTGEERQLRLPTLDGLALWSETPLTDE